jgi:hypothetical protein
VNRRGALAVLMALWASSAAAQESATTFVQRFYDAYLKTAPRWAQTVQNRRALFEPSLADALKADAAAQAKVEGEIVGLDFDPFLGSQDPGPRFEARRAAAIPGGQRVEVFDLTSPAKPMVLVDVAPKAGSWIVTDFHYRDVGDDLRAILKALKAERQQSKLKN